MRKLIEKQPVLFSWIILFIYLFVSNAMLIGLKAYLSGYRYYETGLRVFINDHISVSLLYIIGLVLFQIILITVLRYWKHMGLGRFPTRKELLYYLPPLLAFFLIILPGIYPPIFSKYTDPESLIYYMLMIVQNEFYFRGIIFYPLTNKYGKYGIIIAAIFFGISHITNYFFNSPTLLNGFLHVMRSIALGIGFGALMYRYKSIYPLIILNYLFNLSSMAVNESMKELFWFVNTWMYPMNHVLRRIIVLELPYYLVGIYGIILIRRMTIKDSEKYQNEINKPDPPVLPESDHLPGIPE